MRTKKFVYNSFWSAILQIFSMISGFIIPRIILTFYGSEINGLVNSIVQFLGYLNIVEAGLASAAIYSLYKPLATKNFPAVNRILTAAKKFYNLSGLIFIALAVVLAIIYPYIAGSDKLSDIETGILVLVLGITGAANFFVIAKYQVLLTADQKIYVISIASITTVAVQTAAVIVFANLGVSVINLKLISLSAVFLKPLILSIYLKNHYPKVRFDSEPDYSALKKRWDALYLQILGGIQTGAPVIITTFFLNLKLVSVYTVYNLVIRGISAILSIFISGLFASFGDVIAKGEKDILQRSYREFELSFYMIITVAYSTLTLVFMPFISLYTSGITDQNYDLPLLGFLFILNGLLFNVKTPQGMLVISAGLFRETRIQTTIQALLCILGSVIFVNFYGIYGILAGPLISNLYRDIDLIFFIPKNVTGLRPYDTIVRVMRIFLLIPLIVLSFQYISAFNPDNYYNLTVLTFFAASYSVILTAAVNYMLDRDIFLCVLKRVSIQLFKPGKN